MAGNEQLIDQVISPVVDAQVEWLTKMLADLDIQMSQNIKSANLLNATTSNSKSFAEYSKNATQTTLALEKIQQAQNKTAQTTIDLNAKQAKLAADQQARDEKAAQQLAQKQARQAAADAKEIANAEAKAAKLDAIQKEAARKAAVQFPASQSASNPVTQDTGNVRYEPIITGNENMAITATKSTEAIAAENAVLLEQQEVLGSLTVAQRANIETLLALQAERAANAAELKALNVEDAVSGERAVFLTAEQIKLGIAIRQTTQELNQQAKQALAESDSIVQMKAQVAELTVAYENLSASERENIEIGGVWLAEIERLNIAIKENSISQGIHNKNVGNYATATDIANKVSAQFVRQLVRMAAQFLLITVAFGAIQWLYDWIKNLDVFTGRLDKVIQGWKTWSDVMAQGNKNAGESLAKLELLNKAAQDVNLTESERIKAAETMKSLWPDKLKNLDDEAIMNGKVKKSIDDLTASIEQQALAEAGLSKITEQESKLLDIRTQRDKLNYAKANEIIRAKANDPFKGLKVVGGSGGESGQPSANGQVSDVIAQIKDQTNRQQSDLKAQEAVILNNIKVIEGNIGLGDLAKAAEGKDKKPGSVKDFTNTDLLENNRIKLEEAKKQQKQILDDENYGYEARLVALKLYIARSKDLIANSEAIVNQDKTLRPQQRANELLKLNNQLNDIDREGADERVKIHKSELSKVLEASKVSEQEQLEVLDNGAKLALQALADIRDKKEDALTDQRKREKISEKNFNRELLAINDQYAIDRIAQEIATQKAILAAKEGARDQTLSTLKLDNATPEEIAKFTSGANKGIQGTLDTIANLTTQYGRAKTKQKTDGVGGDTKADDQKRKAIEQAAYDFTVEAIDGIDKLRQRSYENEMARLEKLSEQADENAENQKKIINDSVASNATKAREIALIDAQTSSRKKALLAEENKEKEKAAKADKEATIAKLIAQGALAVVAALTAPPGIGEIEAIARAASVAVELAVALATPLPKYAQGTKNYPGGLGIWGEAGMERATLPSGQIRYSNGAELANFPKGTVITPHMELMQQIRPNEVKFVGGEQIPWRELIKAVKDSKQDTRNRVNVNVDMGFENYKRSYLRR